MSAEAFWLNPDWSGGNTRSGGKPFWMLPPLRPESPHFCRKHQEWKQDSWFAMGYNVRAGFAGRCCEKCYREGSPMQQARVFGDA